MFQRATAILIGGYPACGMFPATTSAQLHWIQVAAQCGPPSRRNLFGKSSFEHAPNHSGANLKSRTVAESGFDINVPTHASLPSRNYRPCRYVAGYTLAWSVASDL